MLLSRWQTGFPCKDFARFKPLLEQAQDELAAGTREARRFMKDA